MRRVLITAFSLVLLAACAHLEIPPGNPYPFRAEFEGKGSVNGRDLSITGALYLTSMKSGTIEIYGPGGMTAYIIDVRGDSLILKDTWGNRVDAISLPLSDLAGLFAGDVPRGAYLYREKSGDGMKVTYHWGKLSIDGRTLPSEVQIDADPAIRARFLPMGKDIILTVLHGPDSFRIRLLVRQGGRWLSS